MSALLLGAGRNTKEDKIDFSAGIILNKKTGDAVRTGDILATLYTEDESKFDSAEKRFLSSTVISDQKPAYRPIILGKVQ